MAEVVVIGGANVDIKGRASGSFVGATSNPGDVTVAVGGVGRNIAENLARLGVTAALATVLGDDANGRLVREACEAAHVDLSLTLTGPAATGSYLAILDGRGELISAVNDMRGVAWLQAGHLRAMADRLLAADMVVADCNIDVACLEWLCAFTAEHDRRLVIEPVSVPKAKKLLAFRRTKPVFAITPNRQQLETLTREGDVHSAIGKLHAMGFENIVAHLGGKGAIASSAEGMFDIPAFPVDDIADVTGAGDAAVAGLVYGLTSGFDLAASARFGQAAAAIKLQSHSSVASRLDRDSLLRLAEPT